MPLSSHQSDRLRSQHLSIAGIIAGLDSEKLRQQPLPGKWSIHDNIAHLACYQPVFLSRIESILKEDKPVFGRYRADDDPEFPVWQKKSTEELLELQKQDRVKIAAIVNSLSDEELSRIGNHPRFGNLEITGWIEFFLLHEAHHIFTVFQLTKTL